MRCPRSPLRLRGRPEMGTLRAWNTKPSPNARSAPAPSPPSSATSPDAVDAIVNAANCHLAHGGGLAAAIVRAGGASSSRKSRGRVAPVPVGSAAVTSAGLCPAVGSFTPSAREWGEGDEEQTAFCGHCSSRCRRRPPGAVGGPAADLHRNLRLSQAPRHPAHRQRGRYAGPRHIRSGPSLKST